MAEGEEEAQLLAKLEQLNQQLAQDNRAVTSVDAVTSPLPPAAPEEAEAEETPEQLRMLAWGEGLSAFDQFAKKKPKRLAELVVQGIPAPLRSMVWVQLARSNELNK